MFWDLYGAGSLRIESVQKQKQENQENILILFRKYPRSQVGWPAVHPLVGKLREGLFASGRKDGFTLEGRSVNYFDVQDTFQLPHPST